MSRPQFLSGDRSASITDILLAGEGGPARVTIADAALLLGGKFTKSGSDLVITGADGHQLVVSGYSSLSQRPDLVTAGGVTFPAHTVDQLALAGTAARGLIVGKVERVSG